MNTAICFAGTGRAIEHTFENLRKNVIDPFEHRDLIIYIVDSPKATEVKRCFEGLGNAYVHIVKEESLAIDKYSLDEGFRGSLIGRHGQVGPQIFFNMLKSRSYLNGLIDQTKQKYDRVIFSRMDVKYEQPIRESIDRLDLSKLWLPNFHNWSKGYNDRFAVSSRENMRHYFSVYDHIDIYAKEGHRFNAELTLKYHLDKKGAEVGIFEVYFTRVRKGGFSHESFETIKTQAIRPCTI
tara:strand:+ start:112 stop:825 length:714 start_codon:yes stop_codon:yes gene_type:complete